MQIKIADIVADPAMQHRPMNEEYVDALVSALATGAVPPVQTIRSEGKYLLWDGFHRLKAHERSGFTDIDADVYDGDRLAAWKASLGANSRHGLRRSRAEVSGIVAACLKNPETAYLRNADLAELLDVSADVVRRIKAEIRDLERETPSVAEGHVVSEAAQVSLVTESPVTDVLAAAAAPAAPVDCLQVAGDPPPSPGPPVQHFRRKQIAIVRNALNKMIPALEELNLFDELRAELVRIKTVVGVI